MLTYFCLIRSHVILQRTSETGNFVATNGRNPLNDNKERERMKRKGNMAKQLRSNIHCCPQQALTMRTSYNSDQD